MTDSQKDTSLAKSQGQVTLEQGLDLLRHWQTPRMALVVLILGVFLLLTESDQSIDNVSEEKPRYFEGLGDISGIEIGFGHRKVELTKTNNQWQISSKYNYPADAEKVAALLKACDALEAQNFSSRNKTKHSVFQVGDNQSYLTLKGQKGEQTLFVGRKGADPKTVFVRLKDSDLVFTASPSHDAFKATNGVSWFDGAMAPGMKSVDINKVVFTEADGKIFELARVSGDSSKPLGQGWRIIKPVQHGAREAAVAALLNRLMAVNISELADPKAFDAATGFNRSKRKIELSFDDGRVLTLKFGKTEQYRTYFKSSMRQGIFKLAKGTADQLFPDVDRVRENDVVTLKYEDTRSLRIEKSQSKALVTRADSSDLWRMKEPDEGDCDNQVVRKLLNFLIGLRFEDKKSKADMKEYGLDKPVLVLATTDYKGMLHSVEFGGVIKDEKDKDKYLACRVTGQPDVYIVPIGNFKDLKSDVRDLRKSMFNFSYRKIVNVTREAVGKIPMIFSRDPRTKTWFGQYKTGRRPCKLDKAKFTALLKELALFKLGEMASSQDFRKVGLDKPQMAWRIMLEDRSRHDLYFGKPLADGKVPVMTGRKRPVVLISQKDFEVFQQDLNKDLRSRDVFAFRFQHTDLKEISLGQRNKPKLKLERRNRNWDVINPNAVAKTSAVQKFVSDLAQLKAEDISSDPNLPKQVMDNHEFEISLKLNNLVVWALFIGAKREDGLSPLTLAAGGAIGVVYLVKSEKIAELMKSRSDFASDHIIGPQVNQATHITLDWHDGKTPKTILDQRKDGWYSVNAKFRADANYVRVLLSQLGNLKPLNDEKPDPNVDMKKPVMTMTLKMPNGAKTLSFGPPKKGKQYVLHMQAPGQAVKMVKSANLANMIKAKADFIDLKAIPGNGHNWTWLRWRLPKGQVVEMKKLKPNDQQSWQLQNPVRKTDINAVRRYFSMLTNLRTIKDSPSIAEIHSAVLTNPEYVLEIKQENGQIHKIDFGRMPKGQVAAQRRVCRVSDRQGAVFLNEVTIKGALPDVSKLEDRTILKVERGKTTKLELRFEAQNWVTLVLNSNKWFFQSNKEEADATQVQRVLQVFENLREEGPVVAALNGKEGLQKPFLTIRITTRENKVHTLEFGARDPKTRQFVLRLDGGQAFMGQRNRFYGFDQMKNKRSFLLRQLFSPNFNQLEEIKYTYQGRTLSILRKGQKWTVAGKELSANEEQALVNVFRYFRADRPCETDDPAKEGFKAGFAKIQLRFKESGLETLEVGQMKGSNYILKSGSHLWEVHQSRFTKAFDALPKLLNPKQAAKNPKKSPAKNSSPQTNPGVKVPVNKGSPNNNIQVPKNPKPKGQKAPAKKQPGPEKKGS